MKSFILLFMTIFFIGCTSTQELKESPTCKVWKEQPLIGPHTVHVQDRSVTKVGKCVFLFWGCSESKTDIDYKGDIYHKSEGVFASRSKIASLKQNEVIYEKSIFDALASAEPIKIDMTNRTLQRKVVVKALDLSSNETIEFNKACQPAEAAVGAVALWINSQQK
ncbi:MAG: hypothetical protein IPM97_07835 [Bdellovibrionaceae bacterium]|nr:hypothetical protein [Pseudobdellovibrionaceae bacterium]